ncbi:MAG: NYN domain-containing protein [Anaerolineae bacterium]|nr:NYN domain-containing protein [Anaerolineae bacterium]
MAYIIDGHNLIGVLPDISLAQPDDEARLVDRLLSYRAARSGDMVVFFDGSPAGAPVARRSGPASAGIDVRYAPAGQSADDAIVEYLRGRRQPGQYAVVTNDQGLIARVRALGASVLTASQFSAQLARRKPKPHRAAALKEAPAPNPRAPGFADLYDEFIATEEAARARAAEPKADLQTWIDRLYTGDPQLQQQAAKVLGQSRNAAAIGPLRDALTAALGSLRSERALGDLIALLKDGNSMVREAAAQALGALGSAKAVAPLQEVAAGDGKNKVRKAAQTALALEAIAARKK